MSAIDAFLAAVSEAGYPPSHQWITYRSPNVTVVEWRERELPSAVGVRAREITGLTSAFPISFRFDPDTNEETHWTQCWLWDNDKPPSGSSGKVEP